MERTQSPTYLVDHVGVCCHSACMVGKLECLVSKIAFEMVLGAGRYNTVSLSVVLWSGLVFAITSSFLQPLVQAVHVVILWPVV